MKTGSDLGLVVLLILFILSVDLGVLVIVAVIYNVVHCNRQDICLAHILSKCVSVYTCVCTMCVYFTPWWLTVQLSYGSAGWEVW